MDLPETSLESKKESSKGNSSEKHAEFSTHDYFKPKPYVQETIYDRPLKVPKYLPDEDGEPWKTWPYPDLQEFSPDFIIPPPKIDLPPGVKIKGYDVDPDTSQFVNFGLVDVIIKWVGYLLLFLNTCKIIQYTFHYANNYFKKISLEVVPGHEGFSSSEGE